MPFCSGFEAAILNSYCARVRDHRPLAARQSSCPGRSDPHDGQPTEGVGVLSSTSASPRARRAAHCPMTAATQGGSMRPPRPRTKRPVGPASPMGRSMVLVLVKIAHFLAVDQSCWSETARGTRSGDASKPCPQPVPELRAGFRSRVRHGPRLSARAAGRS